MRIIGLAGNMGSGKDSVAEILARDHGYAVVAFADELKRLARRVFAYDEATVFGPSSARNAVDPRAADPEYWFGVYHRAGLADIELGSLFVRAPGYGSDDLWERVEPAFKAFLDDCRRQHALTPRYVLQRMGTEWGRALWDGVWVNAVAQTIEVLRTYGGTYTRAGGLAAAHDVRPKGVVVTDARFPNEARAVASWGGKVVWVDAARRVPRAAAHAHASEPTREDFRTPEGDLVHHDLNNNGSMAVLPARVAAMLAALGAA